MDSELAQILDDRFLDGHETVGADVLRERRDRCRRVETDLSYLRRLAQGRIDIVSAELERRARGDAPGDVDALVDQLSAALSDRPASGPSGPMPKFFAPGRVEGELADELAGMEIEGHLGELTQVSTEWLEDTRRRLVDYERRVSGLRRRMFERIDTLGSELVRRYRDGDADIDQVIEAVVEGA